MMNIRDITIKQLQDSLETHRTLCAVATQRAEAAERALVCLAQELAEGEEIDFEPGNIEALDAFIHHQIVVTKREKLLGRQVTEVRRYLKEINELRKQLGQNNERIQDLQSRLEEKENLYQKVVQELEAQTSKARSMEKTYLRDQQAQPAAKANLQKVTEADEQTVEQWLSSEGRSFDRDKSLIVALGKTGKFLVTDFESVLSRATLWRALDTCIHQGLIEKYEIQKGNGRPVTAISLTAAGILAYQQIEDRLPVESQLKQLLKEHKSSRHLGVILEVADEFERLGFKVQRHPITIQVGESGIYKPDLVVTDPVTKETAYLEVELGKKRAGLKQKWHNAWIVGGGRIYLVADKAGALNTSQGTIAAWAAEDKKQVELFATHLIYLKSLNPGDSSWLRTKKWNGTDSVTNTKK